MDKIYIDRTRTIAYQRCPRLGWLTTYEGGKGLQRKTLNPHLLIGIYVHKGINWLIRGWNADGAVEDMRGEWDKEVAGKVLEDCLSEWQQATLRDCWNLVEAQVRAFELVMLPQLLDTYEVLDTEKEECYTLDASALPELMPDLMWMARLDATLRDKQTGDIGPLSIKTTGKWDKRKEQSMKHDMQGCSEMWTLQQRTLDLENDLSPYAVAFVQYLFLMKGYKKENAETGQWEFMSPLTKGYRRFTNEGEEWAHSYWWTCKEMHIKGYSKKGEAQWCEGGAKHNCKGQGWEQVDICNTYNGGIKQWVNDLFGGTIQALAQETDGIVAQQFIMPAPVYRGQQEIDRWKRATVAERRRVAENAMAIEAAENFITRDEMLDKYFPMHTHSCDYPSACAFTKICHEGVTDPVGSGLYEPRKANHPIEEES